MEVPAVSRDGRQETPSDHASHFSLTREASGLCCNRAATPRAAARALAAAARVFASSGHFPFLPQGVRDWFDLFLAAKYAELPFEDFKEEMEDRKKRKPSLPGAGGLRARGGDPAALLRDANRHLLFVCNLLEREAIPSVFP